MKLPGIVGISLFFGVVAVRSATFTVTTAADAGVGSLRQAMLNANGTVGPDFIRFNIGGGGPRTISLLSPLPSLTDPVVIDAATQPGYAGLPIIELNCTGLAGFVVAGTDHVFRFDTSNSLVRGFVINRHGQGGSIQVAIYSFGQSNVVERNFIGTDLTGTAGFAQPALYGILIGSSNNIVRSNVVASTRWYGIGVEGNNNTIAANYLGTDRDGVNPLGLLIGISVSRAGNRIGLPGQGNVIGGCTNGILVWLSSAVSNVLQGNFIGTRLGGNAALGNLEEGITVGLNASYTLIGGTNNGEGNVISGNRWGVVLTTNVGSFVGTPASHHTTIAGNHIGLNAAGSSFIVNRSGGIWVDGSPSNMIGGFVATARNLISGNDGPGIRISGPGSDRNDVMGNYIGLLADGVAAEYNFDGVIIESGALRNRIGELSRGGNIISGNRGDGVRLQGAGTRLNTIYNNYIGLDESGNIAVPNRDNGVKATDEAFNNFIYTSVISGNGLDGIALDGPNVAFHFSELCYIGTDASGRNAIPNGRHGVFMGNGARNNSIGGQTSPNTVISGNAESGVYITGAGSSNNVIRGALIGLSVTDSISLPNGSNGVAIIDAPFNLIGATNPVGSMRGNIISGQGSRQLSPGSFYYAPGILISGQGSFSNRVEGNFIGTDRFGNIAASNGVGIVVHDASRNRIGGTNEAVRNVISGNIVNALVIEEPGASNNVVWGNFIGTDADGVNAVPNGYGILIDDAPGNQIGGHVANSGNLISGNGNGFGFGGIAVSLVGNGAHHNLILLNRIGTDAGGHPLANEGEAVYLIRGPHNNRIGDINFGNTIAFNDRDGVLVLGGGVWGTTVSNSIFGNSIFSNGMAGGGLGINLQPVGEGSGTPTPNDALDPDVGPNNLQNFPVITNVFLSAGNTVIRGYLESQASRSYYIDYYRSTAPDPSGFGEGEFYLGFNSVTTDVAGRANFSFTNSGTFPNAWFTVTATSATTSDTSEFSRAWEAAAGSFRFSLSTRVVNENVGTFPVVVERVGGAYGVATVRAFPFDDTAINSQDYNFGGVMMTFIDGELSKSFNVAVLEDALDENNEIFTLKLQDPTAGTALVFPTITTNSIVDNDPLPTMTIADVSVTEGTGGSVDALFTVTLNTPSGRDLSVNYATGDGTAIAPDDYTPTNGVLTLLAGATTGTIVVPIVTDNLFEPNEKFGVSLTTPVNVTLLDTSATGIILDDDPEPRLFINDIVVTEGDDGLATATFTVRLSNPSYLPVSFNYATANGTALAGSDYNSTNGLVTVPPGGLAADLLVEITADLPSEPDERFFMDLITPVNASIAISRGTCTITELRFLRIERVGNDIRLRFTSGNGQHYAIERATELPAAGWFTPPALSNIPGTGSPVVVMDTGVVSGTPAGAGQFYRIHLLP